MAIIQDTQIIQGSQLDQTIRGEEQGGAGDSPSNKSAEYLATETDVRRCMDFYEGQGSWVRGVNFTTIDLFKAYEYLPQQPSETNEEYVYRIRQSLFINFFKPAVDSFASILSKWEFTSDVLPEVLSAEKNFDKQGTNVKSFFLDADRKALRDGFVGVLTCYPEVSELRNLGQERSLKLRPYSILIDRRDLDIHAFDYSADGELQIESLVVKRIQNRSNGKFSSNQVVEYWVYEINYVVDDFGIEKQYVTRSIYRYVPSAENDNAGQGQSQTPTANLDQNKVQLDMTDPPKVLRDVNGNAIAHIPIVLYSLHDPTPWGCTPPLIGLQQKNRVHYGVYSDRLATIRKLQPTPKRIWQGSVPDNPPPLVIGGQSVIECPMGGDVLFLEASPTCVQPMTDQIEEIKQSIKEETLAFAGLYDGQMTATEATLRDAALQNQSGVENYSNNKTSAIEKILDHWGMWLGIAESQSGSADVDTSSALSLVNANLVKITLDAIANRQLSQETGDKILLLLNYLPKGESVLAPEKVIESPKDPLTETSTNLPVETNGANNNGLISDATTKKG